MTRPYLVTEWRQRRRVKVNIWKNHAATTFIVVGGIEMGINSMLGVGFGWWWWRYIKKGDLVEIR
ncbi:hypothetical protein ASPTUDRAFT_46430 [Aspergillus tubingensis CBS 134.48]|uniref:Uncharacterized protein n=1 Tax=Aspergillus tubingensis (strain CBS 134.48) TaxID=767770 RepID=A0A1L9MVU2_ASPTC|nr:hypothetical protein ASPTUDRAFT_46430 [Aspergillus tubingensis CBS 134.48]